MKYVFYAFFLYIVTNMTISRQRFDKHRLKAGIVEPESTSIAGQRFGKHILEVTQSTVRPPLLGSKSLNTESRDNIQN
jgi:hypothetical protein